MHITMDASELRAEEHRAADVPPKVRALVWRHVRVVSFETERLIKLKMPVRTGRARGSWGHSGPPALPSDSIWREDEPVLAITQGSRLEYIEQLNRGSSVQAPAGFIDAEEVRAQRRLEELIDAIEPGA